MGEQRLTVSEAADRYGVSVSTVRRYAEQYADHLSPYANQRPRTFTEDDVARLSTAYRLNALNESPETIVDAIQDLQAGDVLTDHSHAEMATATASDTQTPLQLPAVVREEVASVSAAAEARDDMLQHQIDTLRSDVTSQGTPRSYLIVGLILGAALALIAFTFGIGATMLLNM